METGHWIEAMSQGKGTGNFPPGTHLSCKTTLGAVIKGNVLATDENFGTLVISEFMPSLLARPSLTSLQGDIFREHIEVLRVMSYHGSSMGW